MKLRESKRMQKEFGTQKERKKKERTETVFTLLVGNHNAQ